MKKNIQKIIEEQRAYYKSIVSVNCPILGETVFFTSEGFNHLLYKSNRQPRKFSERYMKLMCLKHAPEVLKKCTNVSDTRQIKKKIKGKPKLGVRHEMICEIKKGIEIRVIVEKIGTGKAKFLSVMPHNNRSKPPKKPKNTRKGRS